MAPEQAAALAYVRSIVNPAKKAYARAYLLHLNDNGPEPTPPPKLSYMGAQAVRLALSAILPAPEPAPCPDCGASGDTPHRSGCNDEGADLDRP